MSDNDLPKGILKAVPESFVVQELINSDPPFAVSFYEESIIRGWDGESPYTVFGLSKRGWDGKRAMREVARQLGVSFKDVSAHGIKDKHAITSQHIAVKGNFHPAFSHPDISLVQLYGQDDQLWYGNIAGNRFDIFIVSTADSLDLSAVKVVPNLFGQQRLGQEGSEQVGRFFLEGEPEKAIEVLLTTPGADSFLEAVQLAGGSWQKALRHPIFEWDYRFEIHKWQSYLWNKLLQEKIAKFGESIPANLSPWSFYDKEVFEMYKHLWNPPNLETEALAKLSKKVRPTTVRPTDFRAERQTGGWNFKFDLPSAAYATVVLAQLFKLEEPRHSGRS